MARILNVVLAIGLISSLAYNIPAANREPQIVTVTKEVKVNSQIIPYEMLVSGCKKVRSSLQGCMSTALNQCREHSSAHTCGQDVSIYRDCYQVHNEEFVSLAKEVCSRAIPLRGFQPLPSQPDQVPPLLTGRPIRGVALRARRSPPLSFLSLN